MYISFSLSLHPCGPTLALSLPFSLNFSLCSWPSHTASVSSPRAPTTQALDLLCLFSIFITFSRIFFISLFISFWVLRFVMLICSWVSYISLFISEMSFSFLSSFPSHAAALFFKDSVSSVCCPSVLCDPSLLFAGLLWGGGLHWVCCVFLAHRDSPGPGHPPSPTAGAQLPLCAVLFQWTLPAGLRLSCFPLLPPAHMRPPQSACGSWKCILWGSPGFIINFNHARLGFLSSCFVHLYVGHTRIILPVMLPPF